MTDEGLRQRISRRTTIKALGGLGTAGLAGLAGCSGDGDGGDGGGDGNSDGESDGSDGSDGEGEDTESGSTATSSGMDTVNAAWIYITEPGDMGWSWAHDQGRKAAAEKFDWLETDSV
jgi:basic membrane protein A